MLTFEVSRLFVFVYPVSFPRKFQDFSCRLLFVYTYIIAATTLLSMAEFKSKISNHLRVTEIQLSGKMAQNFPADTLVVSSDTSFPR